MSKKDFVEEISYTLKRPFKYADKGGMVEAQEIVLKAPTGLVVQYTSLLESEVNKAVVELTSKVSSNEEVDEHKKQEAKDKLDETSDEDKRDTIYYMLSSAGDLNKCYLALRSIMSTKGHAFADGAVQMTIPMCDSLTTYDLKELLTLYIQNFLNTSLST